MTDVAYIARRTRGRSLVNSGFRFFQMANISDIYFVGGYGTVSWVNTENYETAIPDSIVLSSSKTLRMLNDVYSTSVRMMFSSGRAKADEAIIISVDRRGVDVRVRYGAVLKVHRLRFAYDVSSEEQAAGELQRITSTRGTSGKHVGIGGIDVD